MKLTHKDQWTDTKYLQVSSLHVKPKDYQRLFSNLQGMGSKYQPRLKTDSTRITAFPTTRTSCIAEELKSELSAGSRQKVSYGMAFDQ